jgi:hypothetical protein
MALFGVCYSSCRRTNAAPLSEVSEADVDADTSIIASRKFTDIRTYGVDGGNQWNVNKATKCQLKRGLGVRVSLNNLPATQAQIDKALSQARDAAMKYGTRVKVDLVIGNEVNRQDVAVYSPKEILSAMQYAEKRGAGISLGRGASDNLLQRDRIAETELGMAAGGRCMRHRRLSDGLPLVRRGRAQQHRLSDAVVLE